MTATPDPGCTIGHPRRFALDCPCTTAARERMQAASPAATEAQAALVATGAACAEQETKHYAELRAANPIEEN